METKCVKIPITAVSAPLVLFYLFLYPNQRRQEERNREGNKLHPCLLQTIVTGGSLRSVAVVYFVDPAVH